MTETFALDRRLEEDSLFVADLPLSAVRLMRDATYPWLLLVPRGPGLTEIIDLDERDRHRLMDEIALASRVLRALTQPTKLNVGALGNQVRQLHVHVIARFEGDPAWPGPVWGKAPPRPYLPDAERDFAERIRAALLG